MANFDQWWNNDESIQQHIDVVRQRNYLIEQFNHISRAIDNELPDMALMRIRQTMSVIEQWNNNELP